MADFPFIIEDATIEDAMFLGEALLLAERSHLDYGLWDYILSPLDGSPCIECATALHGARR